MRERIGKFEILREVGQGAMGKVYLGRDPILGREVAVKTIRLGSAFDAEATARFEREARAAGSLNHPNIITIYEFGVDEGLYYMAMEWVEGADLDQVIRARSTPVEELLDLFAQACDGLAFAHERGIVHRDIKPANIMISRTGKRPTAKLMDFGVALVGHSDLTQQGSWMGTVNYMAPEYLDSGKAGPASDLFGMGVVLYEILSGGRRPFTGDTATSVLTAILRQPPAPFRPEETEGLPPALMPVVAKALAKRPEERYASADLLAAAVRQPLGRSREAGAPAPAAAAAHGAAGSGQTLVVGRGGTGQCMSLRVALRQAEPGANILVMPGTYRESLVVDKPVNLLGQGASAEVIIDSPKGPCLEILAAGVSVANLSLAGSAEDPAPRLRVAGADARVEDCDCAGRMGPGAVVAGAGVMPLLRNCTLRGAGAAALVVEQHGEARLEGCLVEGSGRAGLLVDGGSRAVLADSRIEHGKGLGLVLAPGAGATLEDCRIQGQEGGGVEVEADARAEFRRCRIAGSGTVGLLVLEHGRAVLDDCELAGHAWAGAHALAGASLQMTGCRIEDNGGLGASVRGAGLITMENCTLKGNQEPAVSVLQGGTVQMKACKVRENLSFGIVCGPGGRGALESCEIHGNARTGAKVEAGGSLLLVRCDLHDGRDTGILLFENAEVTLEECVVHRNARGGILLAKDAADPVLRGGNKIQDALLRTTADGALVKVTPVR
jgi:serine/threonine-protein kinase